MFTKGIEQEVIYRIYIQWHVLHTPVSETHHVKCILGKPLLQATPRLYDVEPDRENTISILIEAAACIREFTVKHRHVFVLLN